MISEAHQFHHPTLTGNGHLSLEQKQRSDLYRGNIPPAASPHIMSPRAQSSINRGGGAGTPGNHNAAALAANSNFNNSNDDTSSSDFLDLQEMLSSVDAWDGREARGKPGTARLSDLVDLTRSSEML